MRLDKAIPLDLATIGREALAYIKRSKFAFVAAYAVRKGIAMLFFTALITLASVLFYAWLGVSVSRARVEYGIVAPATTGDPAFERLYRVQMNTLEGMVIFLPCLWLFGFYVSDFGAALIGLVWILGRYVYKRGYEAAAEKRALGFAVQALAVVVLFLGAFIDIVMRIVVGD